MKSNVFLVLLCMFCLSASAQWSLTGNGGTTASNFIGTTDNQPLMFRINNSERMRLGTNGYLGINNTNPQSRLHIRGVNAPNYGLFSVQDDNGFGSTGQAFISFWGSDNNRLGYFGPSYSNFVIVNEVTNRLFLSPGSGKVIVGSPAGSWTDYGTNLQVLGTSYFQSNVGIGVTVAQAQLHTTGTVRFDNYKNNATEDYVLATDVNGVLKLKTVTATSSSGWSLGGNASTTSTQFLGTTDAKPLIFKTNNNEALRITPGGQVGIGTTYVTTNFSDPDPNYKLFVEGYIKARKVKVDQATWADYVFSPTYHLPSLKEVEEYIKQHKHLPDVPSEKEVQSNGIDLSENQAILLKKIEELTLYVIQQQKEIEQLKSEQNKLKLANSTK